MKNESDCSHLQSIMLVRTLSTIIATLYCKQRILTGSLDTSNTWSFINALQHIIKFIFDFFSLSCKKSSRLVIQEAEICTIFDNYIDLETHPEMFEYSKLFRPIVRLLIIDLYKD